MAPHRLPSLATLRLGAATGMPGNAEGKRPIKASRVEEPPAAAPAEEPEMLVLTHLPRDVISKVVTQAALDARNAEVPASAICGPRLMNFDLWKRSGPWAVCCGSSATDSPRT